MALWQNGPLVLYHGCGSSSLRSAINPGGIGTSPHPHNLTLLLCRPLTDFGQGFYATTSEHQAKQWANQQLRRNRRLVRDVATVLRFEVDRDDLATLEALVFVIDTADYWNFVMHCRKGFPPHGRGVGALGVPSTSYISPQLAYDVVYGPVSMWPQELIVKDCDQIAFHTTKSLAVLPAPFIHGQGSPYFS
jgi:hypothetical protein